MKHIVASEEEMIRFGTVLAPALARGGIVTLSGPLGAGKTVLVRAIIRALGHAGAVRSPTYTLVESYRLPAATVHHFDLYRLGDPDELEYLGLRDLLEPGALCLFEWPERAAGRLPVPDLEIVLRPVDGGRELGIVSATEVGRAMREAIRKASVNDL